MLQFQDIIDRTWWQQPPLASEVEAVPTMLSRGEQMLLRHLVMHHFQDPGLSIVDAGCFLGGSTVALASGLPGLDGDQSFRIHSYDMFVAPSDSYSLGMIGDRSTGESVLDKFIGYLGNLRSFVYVHAGDFLRASPPPAPIGLLFVDLCKTRDLNAHLLRRFFPQLVPGRSVVVQQDFNDQSCPWVNASMEALKDSFTHICDEWSSRVYLLRETLSEDALNAAAALTPRREIELLDQLIARETNKGSRYFAAVSRAWPLFETNGLEAAIYYLDSISSQQPWASSEPYVDNTKRAMHALKDAAGLERYHRNVFKARHPT